MMKKARLALLVAALSLLATALLPVNATATWAPNQYFIGVGSSAQFNTYALAMGQPGAAASGANPYCGSNYWTYNGTLGTNGIEVVDPRSGTIPHEIGKAIVVWDSNAANAVSGEGIVCVLVSLDSTVGTRLFFANATIQLNSASGAASQTNTVPFMTAGTTLNANVAAWLQTGPTVTAALTDIRPEDSAFATVRALTSPAGTQVPNYYFTGQGYGNAPKGAVIYSSQSGASMQTVQFAIDSRDTDPWTGSAPRNYSVTNIGAAPVMVIRNNTQTGSGHLGNANYVDFNRFGLAQAITGNYTHIRQLSHQASGTETDVALHVFIREPLSGTFNVMEYCIALDQELYPYPTAWINFGQESGVNPALHTNCTTGPCSSENGNPYYHIFSNGGYRGRVIGTGEMISTVNSTADSLGYAFWGYGNFSNKTSVSYSTVDSVDPLFSYPTARTDGLATYLMPQCTSLPCGTLTFPNIANGTYPIWTIYRLVYDPASNTGNNLNMVTGLINYVQDTAGYSAFDFLSTVNPSTGNPNLFVFRSHYAQVDMLNGDAQYPNNGIVPSGNSEKGGDVGGAVLTVQSEVDYYTDTGNNQINLRQ